MGAFPGAFEFSAAFLVCLARASPGSLDVERDRLDRLHVTRRARSAHEFDSRSDLAPSFLVAGSVQIRSTYPLGQAISKRRGEKIIRGSLCEPAIKRRPHDAHAIHRETAQNVVDARFQFNGRSCRILLADEHCSSHLNRRNKSTSSSHQEDNHRYIYIARSVLV